MHLSGNRAVVLLSHSFSAHKSNRLRLSREEVESVQADGCSFPTRRESVGPTSGGYGGKIGAGGACCVLVSVRDEVPGATWGPRSCSCLGLDGHRCCPEEEERQLNLNRDAGKMKKIQILWHKTAFVRMLMSAKHSFFRSEYFLCIYLFLFNFSFLTCKSLRGKKKIQIRCLI